MLVSRLLDTGVGVSVGLLVNVLAWPPLRRRTAAEALDRIDDGIGALLVDIADGLGEGCQEAGVTAWIDRSRDLDGELDRAWALVRQAQESARMNPRRSAKAMKDSKQWHGLLRRMEQAVAETRSLARTLGSQQAHRDTWRAALSDPWIAMLGDAGRGASAADANPIGGNRLPLRSPSAAAPRPVEGRIRTWIEPPTSRPGARSAWGE